MGFVYRNYFGYRYGSDIFTELGHGNTDANIQIRDLSGNAIYCRYDDEDLPSTIEKLGGGLLPTSAKLHESYFSH